MGNADAKNTSSAVKSFIASFKNTQLLLSGAPHEAESTYEMCKTLLLFGVSGKSNVEQD